MTAHLGVGRFAVVGQSGGGPWALLAVGVVSGVGPLDSREATDGMMPMNRVITALARRAPLATRALFAFQAAGARHFPDQGLARFFRMLPPADAAIVGRPEVADELRAQFRRSSPTVGRAATQEFAVFTRTWDFDLEGITVPVHFWQGDVDRNVPAAHAQRQAALVPDAVLHRCEGEGHWLYIDRMDEILATISAARS